ncbi:MgtC/SapB family protein [Leptolyngbya sp. FACHB-261]|uniref:MgtC/SapB family protein n=1 Tax=Leptolyngbya sp. FACHB-261 TaxID=2692806 RepID=UPI00168385BE|nr:MgtC/SapB family protein [Leptolyngbya sp. FACHB-261]MBD2101538.1 MgtC/SapB family protein [Leptolyngbya sp. FACHB-261]
MTITEFWTIVSRLGIALAVGACVGWERQSRHKPAGLRTHMLVSLGAALFVLAVLEFSPGPVVNADGLSSSADDNALSRVIQGIVTGVGFLGAGEVIQQQRSDRPSTEVKGLTSAAAIWVSAALGVAAGSGAWGIALIGAVLTLGTLSGVKQLERWTKLHKDTDP